MAASSEKEMNDNLDRIRADIASLTETMKTLVADSAGIQAALKSKLNATAKQAASAGERVLNEVGEKGAEALEAVHRQADHALNNVEGHIRQNPLAAVLIAAGIGFAFGLINRR